MQAGLPGPVADLPSLGRVYDLPLAFAGREGFRKEPLPPSVLTAARRAAAGLSIIRKERPGLFITETFPFGRRECAPELGPVLRALKADGAALAAVAGYPLLTGDPLDWRAPFMGLYDKAFIFSPPAEKDYLASFYPAGARRRAYRQFFDEQARRVRFSGYLCSSEKRMVSAPAEAARVRVAVVRGGGAYYPSLITEALRAGDILGPAFALTVVAGPSTTDKEWLLFNTVLKRKKVPNAALLRSVNDYEALIAGCDVCVAPAPYHTALALLRHHKRAVLVPFEGYGQGMRFVEQPARSRLLQDHIRSQVVPYDQLSAGALALAVKKALRMDMNGIRIPAEWFAG